MGQGDQVCGDQVGLIQQYSMAAFHNVPFRECRLTRATSNHTTHSPFVKSPETGLSRPPASHRSGLYLTSPSSTAAEFPDTKALYYICAHRPSTRPYSSEAPLPHTRESSVVSRRAATRTCRSLPVFYWQRTCRRQASIAKTNLRLFCGCQSAFALHVSRVASRAHRLFKQ